MSSTKKQKNNNEIDQATMNKIKQELQGRKKQILADLEDITKKDNHEKDNHRAKFPEFGDKADENAQEISEYSTNLATEKVLEKTLRDINNALERIGSGTYGVCQYCHKPIGKKRMQARPVASACVDCKTKLQNS